MAHIREVMAMGVASPLARMLGSNRQMTVTAGGSSQDDATPLVVNYALIQCPTAGGGVRLGPATGAALTALYNSGPAAVNLYPAEDDGFDDQAPNLPLALAAGQSALAVPSIDRWIVSLQGAGSGGGIAEAPSDGNWYGRRNAAWSPVLGLAGGTLTGPLTLAADPAAPMQPATKNYVDLLGGLVAPRNSPTFTGIPRAPTPATGDSSTQIATTAYVQAQGYLTALALAGDLDGAGGSPLPATVVGLQGRALSAVAPANGQVLAWSAANNNWAPAPAPPAAAGGSVGQLQWNSAGSLAGLTIAGDATLDTASGNLTLAAVNPNIGTFQGLTIDAKGRITAAANLNLAPLASPVFTGAPTAPTPATANNSTALATTAFVKAQGYLTGNQPITLSGDASGAGATAIPVTLAAVNGNVGTFQGLTVNAKGLVTAAVNLNYAPLASPAFTGAPTAPSPAVGDNSTALATTAFVKGQSYLTAPVSLTAQVSGILPVVNGGTGLAGGNSGGIPYYLAATTLASSAALAAGALVTGGGAGAAPTSSGTWTIAGNTLRGNLNTATALPALVGLPALSLFSADGASNAIQIVNNKNAAASVGRLAFSANHGTLAAPLPPNAGDQLGQVWFGGYNGTDWTGVGSNIGAFADGAWGVTTPGYLSFFTTPPSGAAVVERLRVASDGGLLVPNNVVGASQGAGSVNVSAGYYVGGVNVTPGRLPSAQGHPGTAPTAITTTTFSMLGLAVSFTPALSGRILVAFHGSITIGTAGSAAHARVYYGSGTAPTNGVAASGTYANVDVQITTPATGYQLPCPLVALISGLSPGTAYWIDVALAVSAGNANYFNTGQTIVEL